VNQGIITEEIEHNHLQLKKPTFKVRRLFGCTPKNNIRNLFKYLGEL